MLTTDHVAGEFCGDIELDMPRSVHAVHRLIVKQLDYDLKPVADFALVGQYLKAASPLLSRVDATLPVQGGVTNNDIMPGHLALPVRSERNFDAIEKFRDDAFCKQALHIGLLPSSMSLPQRLDARSVELFDFVASLIQTLLSRHRPVYGLLRCGWLPLDVDTFAMENSGTANEGVGRTYAVVDGYCPLAAYLGSHGFPLELLLRPGVHHLANETDLNIERLIPMAQRLSAARHEQQKSPPILARLDSGFDSVRLTRRIELCNRAGEPQVD